jgi:class 3 adenylate cyclase
VVEALGGLGLELRAGIHTGECERRGDDLGGIAVHIGARVADWAGPGEVLASGTVKDLVFGCIEFEARGSRTLKGVPGEWRLSAAAPGGSRAVLLLLSAPTASATPVGQGALPG